MCCPSLRIWVSRYNGVVVLERQTCNSSDEVVQLRRVHCAYGDLLDLAYSTSVFSFNAMGSILTLLIPASCVLPEMLKTYE